MSAIPTAAAGVNFGCGVAIANFNGKEKFRTTIGDNAFLGCNTNLVAPRHHRGRRLHRRRGHRHRDVPEDAMLIARAEQTVKPGLARRFRREKNNLPHPIAPARGVTNRQRANP